MALPRDLTLFFLSLPLCLGFQWHSLGRAEQARYYELARQERQAHMAQHPGWTARDNYAKHKKKRRRKEMVRENGGNGKGKKNHSQEQKVVLCDVLDLMLLHILGEIFFVCNI